MRFWSVLSLGTHSLTPFLLLFRRRSQFLSITLIHGSSGKKWRSRVTSNDSAAESRAMMLERRNKIGEVRRVIDAPPRFSFRTNWITATTIDTFLTRETLQRRQCLLAGHEPGRIVPLISSGAVLSVWKFARQAFRGIALSSGTSLGGCGGGGGDNYSNLYDPNIFNNRKIIWRKSRFSIEKLKMRA